MDNERFHELIQRYAAGFCSPEEEQLLKRKLQHWIAAGSAESSLWEKIKSRIDKRDKEK